MVNILLKIQQIWILKINHIFLSSWYIMLLYSYCLLLTRNIIIFACENQNKIFCVLYTLQTTCSLNIRLYVRMCGWQWFKIFNESVRIIIENAYKPKVFLYVYLEYLLSVNILNGIFDVFISNLRDAVSQLGIIICCRQLLLLSIL